VQANNRSTPAASTPMRWWLLGGLPDAEGSTPSDAATSALTIMQKGRKGETMNTDQVTIHGTTYNIISSRTPSQMEQDGYPNVAHEMRTHGILQAYDLQRRRGHKFYSAVRYSVNVFSSVTPLF